MKTSIISIRKKFQKIFTVSLIICLLLVMAVIAIWSYYSYRNQAGQYLDSATKTAFNNIENKAERLTQLSVLMIADSTVQKSLKDMNAIETPSSPRRRSETQNDRNAISGQIRNSVFSEGGILLARIYSRKYDEIQIGSVNHEYLSYPMSIEDIYKANGRAVWGAVVSGDTRCICLARSILDLNSMQPIGYMVITCDASYFSEDLLTTAGPYSTHSFLVDGERNILASTVPAEIGTAIDTDHKIRNGRMRDPLTNAESFSKIQSDDERGWEVVSTFEITQFKRQIIGLLLGVLLLMFVLLTIASVITSGMIRKLVAPTERLVEGMNAFGKGDMSVRVEAAGNDEIAAITRAYNKMADRIQNLMDRVYKMEISNKEAELEFLKMQINPHFLYNSLDTISWMGFACGSDDISDMAVSLASLLRASIKQKPVIQVKEELAVVQSYLNVQHYRFTERFSAKIDVPEDVKEFYMPGFLLQPLIENSIIHGLEGVIGRKGLIEVEIRRDGEWLDFSVSDNGTGMTAEQLQALRKQCRDAEQRNAIGVKNVYRRLYLIYGEESRFSIESAPNQGTRISFRIRVMTDAPDSASPDMVQN